MKKLTLPLAVLSATLATSLLQAQTFQVNTTADTVDANPGDGVCADANGECSLRAAIQEANALTSSNQIRIRLQPGACYMLTLAGAGEDGAMTGDLDVAVDILLDGRGAKLDANGLDRALDVLAGGALRVSRLHVTKGSVVAESGGAIRSAGSLKIVRSQVTMSSATGAGASGGAIFNAGGLLQVRNCEMSGNHADRAGGAIEANAGDTSLRRSEFVDNDTGATPGNGGGLHLTGAGNVDVVDCTFEGNLAAREGGALWNSGSGTMTVNRCDIFANEATGIAAHDGGGGLFNDGGSMWVVSCNIWGNLATSGSGSGGGLFNNAGMMHIDASTISNNISNRAGGGVEVVGGLTMLAATTMHANATGSSPGNGGALHISGPGVVEVSRCRVIANTAIAEGGGLWCSAVGTLTVHGSLIVDNIASGDAADQGGGGLFNDGGTLDVSLCLIDGNVADGASGSGGGILNNAGELAVNHAWLRNNWSNRAGGGIEANVGMTTVSRTYFLGNLTGNTPGNGGGLHLTGAGNVDVHRSIFLFNSADNEGGGLWNSSTGTMTATFTILFLNSSPIGPNAFNDGGTFLLNGNSI